MASCVDLRNQLAGLWGEPAGVMSTLSLAVG